MLCGSSQNYTAFSGLRLCENEHGHLQLRKQTQRNQGLVGRHPIQEYKIYSQIHGCDHCNAASPRKLVKCQEVSLTVYGDHLDHCLRKIQLYNLCQCKPVTLSSKSCHSFLFSTWNNTFRANFKITWFPYEVLRSRLSLLILFGLESFDIFP